MLGLQMEGLFYALTLGRFYNSKQMVIIKGYKFMTQKSQHSISTLCYLSKLEILKLKAVNSSQSQDLLLLVTLVCCVFSSNQSWMQECLTNEQKGTMSK